MNFWCRGGDRVLGAVMFTLIGLVFLKADMKPSLDSDVEASHGKAVRRPHGEVLKNILMGLTMSGINPALLASYTGAIASGKCAFAGNGCCRWSQLTFPSVTCWLLKFMAPACWSSRYSWPSSLPSAFAVAFRRGFTCCFLC